MEGSRKEYLYLEWIDVTPDCMIDKNRDHLNKTQI